MDSRRLLVKGMTAEMGRLKSVHVQLIVRGKHKPLRSAAPSSVRSSNRPTPDER